MDFIIWTNPSVSGATVDYQKSCTTWHVWNPLNNGRFSISTGGRRISSTNRMLVSGSQGKSWSHEALTTLVTAEADPVTNDPADITSERQVAIVFFKLFSKQRITCPSKKVPNIFGMIPNSLAANCCILKQKHRLERCLNFFSQYMIILQTVRVCAISFRFPSSVANSSPVVASGACEAPRCKNRPRWSYYSHPCPTTLAACHCRLFKGRFMDWNAPGVKFLSFLLLKKSSKGLQMPFFSNKEKKCRWCIFQQTHPKSSSFSFWRTLQLYIPKKTAAFSHGFPQGQLCQQRFQCPALDLHCPVTCQKMEPWNNPKSFPSSHRSKHPFFGEKIA